MATFYSGSFVFTLCLVLSSFVQLNLIFTFDWLKFKQSVSSIIVFVWILNFWGGVVEMKYIQGSQYEIKDVILSKLSKRRRNLLDSQEMKLPTLQS